MTFKIDQLEGLEYDDAEELLHDYICDAINAFINSSIGKKHVAKYPEGGGWIGNFIEMGYTYGGFTLPSMTMRNVEEIMEYILPRRLIVFEEEDVTDAIPELVSFWQFLQKKYKLRGTTKIVKYLKSLRKKFTSMMLNPDKGGFMKPILMNAYNSGVDLNSEEALNNFLNGLQGSSVQSPNLPFGNLAALTTGNQSNELILNEQNLVIPPKMEKKYTEITTITDRCCKEFLNDDYLELSRKLTKTLCCCEPSPLNKGRVKSWACGIVRTIGHVNFLGDSSFEPYMRMKDLSQKMGVSDSTASSKSKQIRDLLEIVQMDPDWCTPDLLENNPLLQLKSMLMQGLLEDLFVEE